MKKYFIFILLAISVSINLLANPIFSKGRNFDTDKSSHLKCGKCTKSYSKDSAYCPYCDSIYITSSPIYSECYDCGYTFYFSPDYADKICFNCNHRNHSESSYCSNCGYRMYHDNFYIECPRCKRHFDYSLDKYSHQFRKCKHCKKKYKSYYKKCPYCSNDRKDYYHHEDEYRDRRDYKRDERKEDYRERGRQKERDYNPPFMKKNRVNLDSFLKSDYNSIVKKYSISGYTAKSSFSKVIVNVSQNGKHAPILKTIKIRNNGKTTELNPGTRLTNGQNEFSVNIPEGANEILFSFDHGADSTVKISLEP